MAGLTLVTAGDRSRLGDESLEDGLDDSEWGDMGLASGDAPWWSTDKRFRFIQSFSSQEVRVVTVRTCRDHQRQRGGRRRLDDLVEWLGGRVFVCVSGQQPVASPASRQVADGLRRGRRNGVGFGSSAAVGTFARVAR